ncbi:MAG: NADH-quinone oxidoreductase subunit J [Bacteroidota bacterium]
MAPYFFYFLAFLSILSALMVVFSKNPVYSVLYLVITFFSIAGQYILLNAQFLAAVHVIVYAGAIMVLFLFVVMLLNLNKELEPHKSSLLKLSGVIAAGLLLVTIVGSYRGAAVQVVGSAMNTPTYDNQIGLVKNLGKVLFGDFLLPFEISSVLFLSAMVGAVMLGKKDKV